MKRSPLYFLPLVLFLLWVTQTGCPGNNSTPTSPQTGNPPADTATFTPTFSVTSSLTATASHTPSFTSTFTPSLTPSSTNAFTSTLTPTFTPSSTQSFTPTHTRSSTPTVTVAFTATLTPTFTPSYTPTATPSPTASFTATFTRTLTSTMTTTFTHTLTTSPTFTLSFTVTFTPSPTFSPTVHITETPVCGSPMAFGITYDQPSGTGGAVFTYFTRAVATGSGVLMSLTLKTGGTPGEVQVGLYADNGSDQPGTWITQSTATSVSGFGLVTVDIPDQVLSGPTTYWLAVQTNGGTIIYYGSTGTAYRMSNPTFGNLPSSASSLQSWSGGFEIYGNYCLPTGVPTHTPTPSFTPTFTYTFTNTATSTQTPICSNPMGFGITYDQPSGTGGAVFTYFTRAVLTDPGTLMSLTLKTGGTPGYVQVGLYSDNGSDQPGARITQSSPAPVSGFGLVTVDIPDQVLAAPTTFWLAVQTGSGPIIYYGTTGTAYRMSNPVFGDLPSSASSLQFWGGGFEIYGNYCLPTGVPTHTSTPTFTPTFTYTFTSTPTTTMTPLCGSPVTFGTSSDNPFGTGVGAYVFFNRSIANQTGTAIQVGVKVGGTTGQMQVGIYSDNSGLPGNLMAVSSPYILSPPGFFLLDIPDAPVTNGQTYWLAMESNGGLIAYYASSSNTSYRVLNTFGSFPPSGTGATLFGGDFTIFGLVCP